VKPADGAALLALAALWGGSFLFIRVAVASFGPLPLVACRLALGAALLWAFGRLAGWRLEVRKHLRPLLVLGAINGALPFTLISAAELQLTASFAAVLNATAPLFAAAFGVVWLAERLTRWRVVGLLAGVVGVVVMVGWSPLPLTGPTLLGVLAMLAGSASYAASGVYIRRRLAGVPTPTLAFGQQLGALAWVALPALVWPPATVPPRLAIGAVVALGVLSTAVAYLLYFRLIARVGPTRTSTVTYLLPAFGVLWGALLLDEPISPGMVVGFAIVLVSVALASGVRLYPSTAGAAVASARSTLHGVDGRRERHATRNRPWSARVRPTAHSRCTPAG
jgi:drug/metabolite transporter (DMT)-like permease